MAQFKSDDRMEGQMVMGVLEETKALAEADAEQVEEHDKEGATLSATEVGAGVEAEEAEVQEQDDRKPEVDQEEQKVEDQVADVVHCAAASDAEDAEDFSSVSSDVEEDLGVCKAREHFESLAEESDRCDSQPVVNDDSAEDGNTNHGADNTERDADPVESADASNNAHEDDPQPVVQDGSTEEEGQGRPKASKMHAELAEPEEDALASETTDGTESGDAQVDTDATNSDSDATAVMPADAPYLEGKGASEAATEGRILHVQATLPQDLHFVAPPSCKPGQILTVQGPHGPLHVQAPPGVKAGQRCAVRLAPPFQHEVFVPAGAKPGHKVTFLGENDEQFEAIVPPGKRPGEVFHVSPPVVMVPVPTGATKGDRLAFTTPNGLALLADVPENFSPGQYFSVQY